MVVRHEAPVAAVLRAVAVVAHHPVVVLLEGVAGCRAAIDQDGAVLDLQVVVLVQLDDALIQRQVGQGQLHGGAFLGDPDGTEVVHAPVRVVRVVGEVRPLVPRRGVAAGLVLAGQAAEEGIALLQLGHLLLRQRHVHRTGLGTLSVAQVAQGHVVVLLQHVQRPLVERGLQHGLVAELRLFGQVLLLPVHVNVAAPYLERIAGRAHAALDVMLALVQRTYQDAAGGHKALLAVHHVGQHGVGVLDLGPAVVAHQLVVALVLEVGHHGVALREIEHHGIALLRPAESRQAAVGLAEPGDKAGGAGGERQGVVGEGEGERGHRHARPVAQLAHEEVVAHQQALLHGGGGDGEGLEGEGAEHRGHDHREQDGIAPLAQQPALALLLGDGPDVLELLLERQLRDLHPGQEGHEHMVLELPLAVGDAQVHVHDDEHEQVHPGHQQQDQPPPGLADQLVPHVEVVARHEAFPGRAPRLHEELPQRGVDHREVGEEKQVGDHGLKCGNCWGVEMWGCAGLGSGVG